MVRAYNLILRRLKQEGHRFEDNLRNLRARLKPNTSCWGAHATVNVERSENNFWELVLSC